jgi:hypothetical protein
VSGQLRSARVNSEKASPSNSLFIKSCFCLWPVRMAFKARFVPVVSIVDSDASRSCNLEFDDKKQLNR